MFRRKTKKAGAQSKKAPRPGSPRSSRRYGAGDFVEDLIDLVTDLIFFWK
jgi:hypothetical protein